MAEKKTADKPSDEKPFVASPSGPVPLGAVATGDDAEDRADREMDRLEAEEKGRVGALDELTDEQIDSMNGPELRALADTRGYQNFPLTGTRTARARFRDAQADDKRLSPASRSKKKSA